MIESLPQMANVLSINDPSHSISERAIIYFYNAMKRLQRQDKNSFEYVEIQAFILSKINANENMVNITFFTSIVKDQRTRYHLGLAKVREQVLLCSAARRLHSCNHSLTESITLTNVLTII